MGEEGEKKIEPEKWYWLYEAFREGYFEPTGIRSFVTIRAFADKGMLKVTSWGSGMSTRRRVRGKNIIEFLAKYEAGDFHK